MVILTMSSAAGPSTPSRATVITHPNRDKPVVQTTRVVVVLLLLISAGLMLVVTAGGWSVLQSAWPIQVAYIAIYVLLAFYAARWRRGILPVAAALAVILLVFALVAGPFWFDRDKAGFSQPGINAGLLGTITLLIVPVQMLLIAFAMRGFSQGWNVEVERPAPLSGGRSYPDAPTPHPA